MGTHRDSGTPTDGTAVRSLVSAWMAAIAEADGDAACARMTTSAQAQLSAFVGAADCREAVRMLATRLSPPDRAALRSTSPGEVRFVTADRGTVTVGEQTQKIQVRRVSDQWVISDLGTALSTGTGGAFRPPPTNFQPSPPDPGIS